MKKIILTSVIATFLLTSNFAAHAEIYKWKDSKGVIHYSARPPAQKTKSKIKVKDIEQKIKSAAGKYRPTKSTSSNKESTEGKSNTQQDQSNSVQLSAPSEKLVAYCNAQRKSLTTLKENFRNIWKDLDGTEKILNQAQRKQKVDYLIKRIKEDCDGV